MSGGTGRTWAKALGATAAAVAATVACILVASGILLPMPVPEASDSGQEEVGHGYGQNASDESSGEPANGGVGEPDGRGPAEEGPDEAHGAIDGGEDGAAPDSSESEGEEGTLPDVGGSLSSASPVAIPSSTEAMQRSNPAGRSWTYLSDSDAREVGGCVLNQLEERGWSLVHASYLGIGDDAWGCVATNPASDGVAMVVAVPDGAVAGASSDATAPGAGKLRVSVVSLGAWE